MNLYSRLFLVSCMFASVMYGQQRFFIADPTQATGGYSIKQLIVRDSEDLNLEHALFDYHHYYTQECGHIGLDFQVAPFYTHLKTIEPKTKPADYVDTRATTQMGGAQFQAQLDVCDFYLRANTAVGQIKSTFANITDETQINKKAFKFTGFDDVTLKTGYDFFFCKEKHHTGLYLLGGFPVNHQKAIEASSNADMLTQLANSRTERLGVYSYRFGAGMNSAFTLYNCNERRLTLHADVQYAYAFKTKLAIIDYNGDDTTTFKYTPGQFVSAWTALHYAHCHWNFEVGSMFETMFDEKRTLVNEGNATTTFAGLGLPETPGVTVAFLAKPYIATSYNTTVCKNPLTVGLGLGYEYDKMHDLQKFENGKDVEDTSRIYNAFQGVNVWGNITYSF